MTDDNEISIKISHAISKVHSKNFLVTKDGRKWDTYQIHNFVLWNFKHKKYQENRTGSKKNKERTQKNV